MTFKTKSEFSNSNLIWEQLCGNNSNNNIILDFNSNYGEVIDVFKAYNDYQIEQSDYERLKDLCIYLKSNGPQQ